VGKPEGRGLLGKPRCRCEDNIKMHTRNGMEGRDCWENGIEPAGSVNCRGMS
jgi:Zn ribbon nucleic-acid-binding protein